MSPLQDTFRNLFSKSKHIPAGMYHYQAPPEDPRNYRLHLRMEADGSGVLVVNAATVLHLNHTAAEYAYYLVQNIHPDEVAKKMARRYEVLPEQARQDYQSLVGRIMTLIETPDLDPVTFLDFERQAPYSGSISAPYRLDCALTYRLSEAAPGAAPEERVKRELSATEWQTVLDKASSVGIPHIVFTGGEPTLRADLPELIARAEANAQVTGLLSDGLALANPAYLEKLLQTGLDHLMLILQPENETAWTALSNALAANLFVAVHLTLTAENADSEMSLLKRLAEMGVKAVSLSAADPSYNARLQAASNFAAQLNLELIWNLPVPYSAKNPIALETEPDELLQGAGRAWMYVEPDGDVLPTQGVNQVLGNLLNDPWEKIWKGRG